MNEQKNEKKEMESNEQKPEITSRSMILWALGGIYLLYTGYRLCQSVLSGAEDSGWGFFAAGVFFIVVGIVLLFMSIKSYNEKIKKEKTEKEAQEGNAENAECCSEEITESEASGDTSEEPREAVSDQTVKKPMSIAERARLASTLGDAEETGEEETERETE